VRGRLLIIPVVLVLAGCGSSNVARSAHTQTQGSPSTTIPALTTTTATTTASTSTAPGRTRTVPAQTASVPSPTTTSLGTATPSGGVASSAPNIGCPAGDTQSGLACLYHGGDPAGNPSGKVNPTSCPGGTTAEDGGCMPGPSSGSGATGATSP
jgi:hypothetical protein